MGKLALTSSICAKAPSEGSNTARNRMQVKITTINFFPFFFNCFLTSSLLDQDLFPETTLKSQYSVLPQNSKLPHSEHSS
jgi:hypothetical protein